MTQSVADVMDSGAWAFGTEAGHNEPNAVGVLDRLHSVDDALGKLRRREDDLIDFQAPTSKEMGIDFVAADQDSQKRGGVFLLRHPEFKEPLEIGATGIKAACNFMNTEQSYFKQFPQWQERFMRDFRALVDHKGQGIVIRTGTSQDGINRRVESFVRSDFDRTSDAQILGAMLHGLKEKFSDQVRGVQILNDGQRGILNYRVLFGQALLKEDPRDPTKAVLPMLSFTSSELGMVDSKVALGLYRIYCRNGMMRTDWEGGIAKWSRKNRPNGFVSKIGEIIGNVGHFAAGVANAIGPRMNEPLGLPAIEILANLHQRSLIGHKHHEAAARAVEYSPASTEYDFLNILTDSAKQITPLTARQEAESTALRLAMQPNGFKGVYLEGFSKDAARAQAQKAFKAA